MNKEYIQKAIWAECNKANHFLDIPGIYRHFKLEKNGEEMLYAVSNISMPTVDGELIQHALANPDAVKESYMFNHTEYERPILINRIGDKYYHDGDMEPEILVIYTALYADRKTYVRPLPMFISKTDKNKYPNAKQEFRLEKVK